MKFIKFLLLLFISFQSFGQNNEYNDNLKQIPFYVDSLKSAKTIDEKLRFYVNLDYYYSKIGKSDSAYYYSNLAYNLLSSAKENRQVKIILNNIGNLNSDFGNYQNAIKNYTEGLNYFENIKDTTNIKFFLTQIIITYRKAKDYKSQLVYSKKYLNFESDSYTNIGDSYLSLKVFDSALFYFNKDYEISLKDSLRYKSIPLFNLGEVNYSFDNYEIALTYYKKGLSEFSYDLQKGLVNEYYYPEIYRTFAKCYDKLNKLDSSLFYARKSYGYAKILNYKSELVKSAEFLFKLFEQKKVFDSAYVYQNIYLKLHDSLYNSEKVRDLQILTINESIRQQKIQEEIEKVRDEREKNLILAAIGFFIPVFISMVFLVSKWNKNFKFLTSLGIASLLMLFEFINLLIHPLLEKITHHNVILMYIILLIIASALVPLHHRMERFVKERFS